ncbi:MAG TPA: TerC family protein [Anaerolineales bacterium]|nr:TerC family protein [Anaerolineales bacterium]
MAEIFTAEALLALVTLTVLEIVLGIDNIIFISILAGRLPENQQQRAVRIGLAVALITRVLLLLSISWVIGLTAPLFSVAGFDISGRDLILLLGGLFLLAKSTHEIHERLEGEEEGHRETKTYPSFSSVILQIGLLDIVFSLDSVITAVGMANQLWVMITAVVIAIAIMMFAADTIGDFVNRHPTVKMLALSFLLLIGFTLIVEALHFHIPKGYIYFAMGFSVFVEMLNLRIRARAAEPIHLRQPYVKEKPQTPREIGN